MIREIIKYFRKNKKNGDISLALFLYIGFGILLAFALILTALIALPNKISGFLESSSSLEEIKIEILILEENLLELDNNFKLLETSERVSRIVPSNFVGRKIGETFILALEHGLKTEDFLINLQSVRRAILELNEYVAAIFVYGDELIEILTYVGRTSQNPYFFLNNINIDENSYGAINARLNFTLYEERGAHGFTS